MRFGRHILLSMCGLLMLTAGCGSAGKKSNEEGLAAYHAGNYERAIGLFLQAVTQDSDRAEYYTNLGMAQCQTGEYESAIDSFLTAIEHNSHTVNAWRGMGIACMELELYDDALEAFDKALSNIRSKHSEQRHDLIAYHAEACVKNGDYDRAIEDYNTLIEEKYETEQMYICLGHVYLQKNDAVSALTSYQKSINLGHRDFEKYLNMIRELKSQGFQNESVIVQEAALSIVPQDAEEHYYRGLIYLEQGQAREAFAEFEQSYNIGCEKSGYCLGYCYELRGEYSEAELIYQKLLTEVTDGKARIYNQLAACKIRQQKYDEALMLIGQGMALSDQSVKADLLWNQAMCYEGKRDYDAAIDILVQYQQQFPDDENCRMELSYLRSR